MTCNELRARLADPASAAHGGHAAVVDHLGACADCRSTARAFGTLERLFRPEAAGQAPADLDRRVTDRILSRGASPGGRTRVRATQLVVVAAAVATLTIVAVLALRRGPAPAASAGPTAAPSPSAPPAVRQIEAPPPILAVNRGPVSVLGPPLSEAERDRAAALADLGFLRSIPLLLQLDPLFPDDGGSGPVGPDLPAPRGGATGPPDTPERRVARTEEWRMLPPADRELLASVDAEFRTRSPRARRLLLDRWAVLSSLGPEERAGVTRLAARFEELDPARLAALKSEFRRIGSQPAEKRATLWKAHPFARSLTGQELQGGAKLLASW